MKKIVLFSPTGYVGTYLKKCILCEPNLQLVEITRDSNLDVYQGDYDIMVYSAAVSNAELMKYVQDNVVTAIHIVDFCKKHHIKRIIYLSSDSVYGDLSVAEVTGNTVMVNPGIYGTTKYLAEKIIMESKIPYYIIRMPGIVGRVWRSTYLCRLIDQLSANECINVYNADKPFNNVLDIDDLIKFVVILCKCEGHRNEIFLLGNTEKLTLQEIIDYIREICNSASDINYVSEQNKRYFTLNLDRALDYGYSSKKIRSIIDELYRIKQECCR